jgi:hypothetical protein
VQEELRELALQEALTEQTLHFMVKLLLEAVLVGLATEVRTLVTAEVLAADRLDTLQLREVLEPLVKVMLVAQEGAVAEQDFLEAVAEVLEKQEALMVFDTGEMDFPITLLGHLQHLLEILVFMLEAVAVEDTLVVALLLVEMAAEEKALLGIALLQLLEMLTQEVAVVQEQILLQALAVQEL